MRPPHHYRKGIPFFYDKTESEFREDIYEKYDEIVTKQSALHLADVLWKGYPMQAIVDFINQHLHLPARAEIIEIGCSVGRLIGSIAQANPATTCWALDYSYQLLKRAKEFWIDGTTIHIDVTLKGMQKVLLQGTSLKNLHLGLAKAEDLPFDDETQDTVISSFLLDRLQDPFKGLHEMHRVLKKGGQMMLISPLNFTKTEHWQQLYPLDKIKIYLETMGFEVSVLVENMPIIEPLDIHGNVILWKCLALACKKT